MWIDIIIILLLILVNGFFALSEIAIVSAKRSKLETERKAGKKGAVRALKLQADPDNFLSSIQVGITLIGIINGAYGGQAFAGYLVPFFERSEERRVGKEGRCRVAGGCESGGE